MSGHTKGPWTVIKHNHAAGELWLSVGHGMPDGSVQGPVIDIVAKRNMRVEAGELKYIAVPEAEQWANARLMAAAPAMLEALEAVMYFWGRDPLAFGDEATINSLAGRFAAIADQCRLARDAALGVES